MAVDFRRLGCGLVASATLAAAQAHVPSGDLNRKLEALIKKSPAIERGHIGYKFAEVETGAVLAERDASSFFTPASNAKLYTTALALVRLGTGYQFRTQLRTAGVWKPGQEAIADLQLIGGGDPNISGRALPYLADAPEGDPLAALRQMADQVVDAGIREIKGDVTGVASRYGSELYPDGWTLDDSIFSYGAPVSALTLNDNSIAVVLRPSESGELADVDLRPALCHFLVQSQVVTDGSAEAHVTLRRPPGSNQLILSGTIGQLVSQWREDIAVEDPALFAAEALTDLLRERGVTVEGMVRTRYEPDTPESQAGTLLAERLSQPLSEVLRVINKVSQNLHAEMLLREVASVRTGVGSLEKGQKERELFLNEVGVTRGGTGYAIDDGSGLARQDLTTPASTVALLRYMWGRPEREVWVNTLPIGGLDGSLQHRFRKIAGARRLRAKTGSLSHVNTLSGYIETKDSHRIAFSVMVNGTVGHEKDVRDFIDQLCAVFLSR